MDGSMRHRQEHRAHFVVRTLAALALVGAIVWSGCRPTLEEETAALIETDVRFAATSRDSGTAEAFFRYMAPDGMLLRPGQDPLRGPQAIKDRMSGRNDIILSWVPRGAEVSSARDIGYTWGTYAVERATPQGVVLLGTGRYLNVWRKQPDGTWKVIVDIGNQDPPAQPTKEDP